MVLTVTHSGGVVSASHNAPAPYWSAWAFLAASGRVAAKLFHLEKHGGSFFPRLSVRAFWLKPAAFQTPAVSQASITNSMKVVAAYLLAALGGNASPGAADIKKILSSGEPCNLRIFNRCQQCLHLVRCPPCFHNPQSLVHMLVCICKFAL